MSTVTANLSDNTRLSILLKSIENPEQTIKEIDAEIAKRETELSKLKQLKKALGGKSNRDREIPADVENKIVEAVKDGPLRPKEIKKLIGVDAAFIGRIVSKSARLSKTSDNRVQLKK
jgi:uncharacterized protein YpuA (DUF1002 family)